jgi:hypothetical protein
MSHATNVGLVSFHQGQTASRFYHLVKLFIIDLVESYT